jgi:hypothetical protein
VVAVVAAGSSSALLVLRADHLGDPHVVALCELAQSGSYRKKLRGDLGYEPRRAGEIRVGAGR